MKKPEIIYVIFKLVKNSTKKIKKNNKVESSIKIKYWMIKLKKHELKKQINSSKFSKYELIF
jgi:hypothetical protein